MERFIQTMKQECLDYFIVFGPRHMDHLVSEMTSYYHEERLHQAKENNLLVPTATPPEKKRNRKKEESPPDVVPVSQIKCRQRLGGLLKHYYRKAA